MPNFDIQNGPSLSDLMTQKAMQQAQLGAMGQESQLRQLQMQQAQQDMAQKSRLRDLFQQMPEGVDPSSIIPALMRQGPEGMALAGQIQALTQKKQPKFHVVGGALVPEPTDGQNQVNPVYTAPDKPEKVNPNQPFMLENGQIVPNKAYQTYEMGKTIAGRPSVSVTMGQEKEEAKAVGKGFGEQYMELQKSGMGATGKLARYDRMKNLMQGVETGKLAPTGMQISAIADSFGIKIDPTLPAKQAIEALSNEIALELRNPSGGAGMPGAMSDKDREFLVSMTPGMSKTPGGNELIIETAKKLAKRDQDVAALARQYRMKKGTIDEGFYNELVAFADSHPLFPATGQPVTAQPAANVQLAPPKVGMVQGGYVFMGGDPANPASWKRAKP